MRKKRLIMGICNKHGIFRKVKWLPHHIVISMDEYKEYKELKKMKAVIDMAKEHRERCPETPIMFKLSPDAKLELV